MAKYNVYEKDGAVFRGKAGAGFVTEIQGPTGWMHYEGDPIAPVIFGDFLRSEDDKPDAGELTEVTSSKVQPSRS